jgi:membrane protease YdiL (CAAX protease family)
VARGSKVLQRSYVLLPLIFGLAFLSACVVWPFVNVLNNEIGKKEAGGSHVYELFTQTFTVLALVYFLVFRRHMRSRVVESLNVRISTIGKHLILGLVVGAVAVWIIIGVFYAAGALAYDEHFVTRALWSALLSGLGVALLEEIVFRGVVLQNLQADMEAFFAVVFASAFFAAMHFVQPLPDRIAAQTAAPSFAHFHLFDGFRLLPYQFQNFTRLEVIWPFALGLFLIGVVLALAYVKTGTLYLPMGIHAGFVAMLKLDGSLFKPVETKLRLLFGVARDWQMSYTDSLVCWLVAVVLIVLLIVFGAKLRACSTAGKS